MGQRKRAGVPPEAGRLANSMQLGGSAKKLRENLRKHDLGSGAADCGCVVMDYRFYPCKKHAESTEED